MCKGFCSAWQAPRRYSLNDSNNNRSYLIDTSSPSGERNDCGTETASRFWSVLYFLPDEFWLVSVSWTYAHGRRMGRQRVCLRVYVCTQWFPRRDSMWAAAKANIVLLMWLPCRGSLASFRRMSATGWRMRALFPKQLKTWQRWWTSVPTGLKWVGGLLPILLFPQGPEQLFRIKQWLNQPDTAVICPFDILLRNY